MKAIKNRYIISGGGTGGHIFPAIAIANGLKERVPEAEILFIGADGHMEMEKVPRAGYKIIGLNVSGIRRGSVLNNIPVMIKFVLSVIKARRIVRKFKPETVIGVGGYASGAVLKAASMLKVRTVIQEQNSLPGKTNKMLASHASAICVAYEGLGKYFPEDKIIMTGNPVRKDILTIKRKTDEAYAYFNLPKDKPVIFFVGGSQGALAINEAIANNINGYACLEANIVWQTGKSFFETAKAAIAANRIENIKCLDFVNRMDYAYGIADLVISRAGAIAISELEIVGLPSVFVPLPTAAENHQMVNAMALVNKDAAMMVENSKVDSEMLSLLRELINDEDKLKEMSENIKKMALPDAVNKIVDTILQ
ncbi:MAG: undecaprenyldiphospho-muramoylpentapeptide beta-N-acetylglucosaminyltransferase [Bacteroidales bacterium]|nr:undecaprenyldiphospho-muramoylpentapeptide beta-N-acetylglucosaminyltransferase [Bacteroidales bacterium]